MRFACKCVVVLSAGHAPDNRSELGGPRHGHVKSRLVQQKAELVGTNANAVWRLCPMAWEMVSDPKQIAKVCASEMPASPSCTAARAPWGLTLLSADIWFQLRDAKLS
eukprot:679845-Lingulodinium_polyedra.AAC.1